MGLKSLNIEVNDYCNNKCTMCSIWKNPKQEYFTAEEYAAFFRTNDFSAVEDVSITGGEPFMRDDLGDLVEGMLPSLPALRMLFFNTNGTYPSRARLLIDRVSKKVPKLYGCVSIEGEREAHNKVRGVRGYDLAVQTLSAIARSDQPNVQAIISMTITKENQEMRNLEHIRELSEEFGCGYTFRIADTSGVYYLNEGETKFAPDPDLKGIVEFIEKHKADDPFLQALKGKLLTGEVPIMGGKEEGISCRAGEIFAFITAEGDVHPCIYSPRVIGSVEKGFIPKKITDLGRQEPCPCCTECTIYPMLNYGKGEKKGNGEPNGS